jgi:hypothetical protein
MLKALFVRHEVQKHCRRIAEASMEALRKHTTAMSSHSDSLGVCVTMNRQGLDGSRKARTTLCGSVV